MPNADTDAFTTEAAVKHRFDAAFIVLTPQVDEEHQQKWAELLILGLTVE